MNAATSRTFPRASSRSGSPATAPSSISIRRSRSCRCCRSEFGASAGRSLHHHHRQHVGGGADRAVHRRRRRRAGPQARDRRGDVRAGDPDRDGRRWRTSLPALIFWRCDAGAGAAADLRRHHRLYRRRMAAAAKRPPPPASIRRASSLGGFSGRLFTGLLADLIGWRAGFIALAAMTLAGAVAVAFLLPRERKFVRSEGPARRRAGRCCGISATGNWSRPMRSASACCSISFCTFTFVSFHLAAPPYNLSATWLGAIFVVYLAGSVLTPWTGWAVGRFGRRHFMVCVIAMWTCGIVLTLAPSLPLIILGLAIGAGLRPDLPGGLDRLCDHHRQGRPLVGGRTLRDQLLRRWQFRRGARRPRLDASAAGRPASRWWSRCCW